MGEYSMLQCMQVDLTASIVRSRIHSKTAVCINIYQAADIYNYICSLCLVYDILFNIKYAYNVVHDGQLETVEMETGNGRWK